MPATLALIVAFAPQSSGFFSPVEPLVLLLDGQSGDLAVVGESQNLAPARGYNHVAFDHEDSLRSRD
jgi:hypothetical protein